jgi:hypothetical protein
VVGADNRRIGSTTPTASSISRQPEADANLRVYTDLMNLNDSLLRYYQGVPDRVLQEEHYHWWMNFGVKIEF